MEVFPGKRADIVKAFGSLLRSHLALRTGFGFSCTTFSGVEGDGMELLSTLHTAVSVGNEGVLLTRCLAENPRPRRHLRHRPLVWPQGVLWSEKTPGDRKCPEVVGLREGGFGRLIALA